jgi:nuclear pore complex protein Nup155
VPHGWAPRILLECGVPPANVWDLLNEMYESQVPPFNTQANVQAVSSDIAVFLEDWTAATIRQGAAAVREFPAGRVASAIDQYVAELETSRTETRARYELLKKTIRKTF